MDKGTVDERNKVQQVEWTWRVIDLPRYIYEGKVAFLYLSLSTYKVYARNLACNQVNSSQTRRAPSPSKNERTTSPSCPT